MGTVLLKIAAPFLGLLFLIFGLAKADEAEAFSAAILREIPLPPLLGMPAAVALIITEVLAGVGLFVRRTRKTAALAILGLLLLFLAILLRHLLNGTEFSCRCLGLLELRLPVLLHFALNCFLALAAFLVARRAGAREALVPASRRLPAGFYIVGAIGLLVFLWGLLSAFRSVQPEPVVEERVPAMDIAFPVKVRTARQGTLIKEVTSSGLLRPLKVVEIIPRVNGQIVAVNGFEGKEVSKGELLVVIDPTEYRLAYERASAALLGAQIEYRTLSASPFLQSTDTLRARLDLEAAREHYQRVRTAYAAGRIDGPALFRARRAYEAVRAYVSANREDVIDNRSGLAFAREAFERARLDLEATQIRAPFTGRIGEWNVTAGMQARAGQPLCSVMDVCGLLIDADIVEGEAGKIRPGARAVITCIALPDVRFSGNVLAISPLIDPHTRMMRVTIALRRDELCRPEALGSVRPGMYATVKIETARLEKRLLVPRQALLMRDLRNVVFVVNEGRARWHYVETGEENREFAEIRSGLNGGDSVIVDGHHALAHDARIKVMK